ncbi:MAG: inositol monophosphatase [Proteobacteria bacterium]|nr:inositol monophosphatase [Pseudomonadota bacterium]
MRDLLGGRGQAKSATVNVMIQAALKAARGLVRDFGEIGNLQISKKGPADFVSNADLRSDRTLREELKKARPTIGFLTEEGEEIVGEDASQRWIIDPLDGTTNFLHSIPHFAISIGLEKENEIVAAVVYDPIKDELFWAEKGMGTFMNDRRIRVSERKDLSECLMATGTPFKGHGNKELFVSELVPFLSETSGIRRLGAAALDFAYVAAGRFDGYWEHGIKPWDAAAGILLVKEAGGYTTTIDGKASTPYDTSYVAAPPQVHGHMLRLLKS